MPYLGYRKIPIVSISSHFRQEYLEKGKEVLPDASTIIQGSAESVQSEIPSNSDTHLFHFTGSGAEYFKIWIVNLCLTLATLGIYSAWAKVRRLQYFDRNTQLAGAVVNFHGSPVAIVKGRLLVLVLLVAYHYAFGFSKIVGFVVIGVLFLILPWLLRNALRFRLRSTSYRGIRFNFTGNLSCAYLCYTPLLAVFLLPTVSVALFPNKPLIFIATAVTLYLSWPIIHAAMKRFQQSNIDYGDHSSTYNATNFSLIKPYLLAFAVGVGLVISIGILVGITIGIWSTINKAENFSDPWMKATGVVIGMLYLYGIYLITGPFLQVKIWNLVWNNTRFPGFTIRSDLKFVPYLRLQTVNIILTLLSLGLYRPFAVVRAYRYRLTNMSITGNSFDLVTQLKHTQQVTASGDSSADLFDIDLSF